jgi:hypothetical protein
MRWWWDPLCSRPTTNTLRWFFSASSLKQEFADRHVASLGHIISILRVYQSSNIYRFYSLWLDRGSNPLYTTLEASTLTITPLMRSHKLYMMYISSIECRGTFFRRETISDMEDEIKIKCILVYLLLWRRSSKMVCVYQRHYVSLPLICFGVMPLELSKIIIIIISFCSIT